MPRQQKRAGERAETKAKAKKKPSGPPSSGDNLGAPRKYKADDLDDRKVRGVELFKAAQRDPERMVVISDETTIFWSPKLKDRAYRTTRKMRNLRGTMQPEYRCTCPDFVKDGRGGCEHIFAEWLRRKEAVVIGEVSAKRLRSEGGAPAGT